MNTTPITLMRLKEGSDVTLVKWLDYSDGWYGYTKTNLAAKPRTAMSEPSFYSRKEWTAR